VDRFEAALKADAEYAPALAGIGYAYYVMGWYATRRSKEVMPLGKAAAEKALHLDPDLALGHAVLGGFQAVLDWNWAEAERSFHRAVEAGAGCLGCLRTCIGILRRSCGGGTVAARGIERNRRSWMAALNSVLGAGRHQPVHALAGRGDRQL
jgi:hypothetical protein